MYAIDKKIGEDNLKLIVDKSEHVNAKNNEGFSALMMACVKNDKVAVEALINNGVDINAFDKSGRTALIWSVINNSFDTTNLLVQHNANQDISDNFGKTAKSYAIEGEILASVFQVNLEKLTLLLEQYKPNLNFNNGNEVAGTWTPLLAAISIGNVQFIEKLLCNGANINYGNFKFGWTPLHYSIVNKSSINIINILLSRGANTNLVDTFGRVPVLYAEDELIKEVLNNYSKREVGEGNKVRTFLDASQIGEKYAKSISNSREK